ncbi:MAG: glycosyl hydrolase 53 family protein [Bacteroidales bacterium]|nr:glycosyl hydrolase 53 family protein [Bacteroidales bacterium]
MKKCLLMLAAILIAAGSSHASTPTKAPANGYPDFAIGGDLSWQKYIEDNNYYTYYESTSATTPFTNLETMCVNYGFDAVRLRVWVDPTQTLVKNDFYFYSADNGAVAQTLSTYGTCSISEMQALAKRYADMGMRVMVSFQLSDTWADPGKQFVPKSWESCSTISELASTAAQHVSDVLQVLHDNNVNVAWVQIGNETNYGMLKYKLPSKVGSLSSYDTVTEWDLSCRIPFYTNSGTAYTDTQTANFVTVWNACADAAKAVYPDTKTVLHLTKTTKGVSSDSWWGVCEVPWVMKMLQKNGFGFGTKCDLIGLSLYPTLEYSDANATATWKSGSGWSNSLAVISLINSTYNMPVIICETGMNCNYSTSNSSSSNYYKSVTQCNTDVANYASEFFSTLRDGSTYNCVGVFYWEPEGSNLMGYALNACYTKDYASYSSNNSWPSTYVGVKVVPNPWWDACKSKSKVDLTNLVDFSYSTTDGGDNTGGDDNGDEDETPATIYYVGSDNSWSYTSPTALTYDSTTGLFTGSFTTYSTNEYVLLCTAYGDEDTCKAAGVAPSGEVKNGVTMSYTNIWSGGFQIPYAATWTVTVNPSALTINFYTATTAPSTGDTTDYDSYSLYVYDSGNAYYEMSTDDGNVYYVCPGVKVSSGAAFVFCKDGAWSVYYGGAWVTALNTDFSVTSATSWNSDLNIAIASTCYWWFNKELSKCQITSDSTNPWESETVTYTGYTVAYNNGSTAWEVVFVDYLDADGNSLVGVTPGMRMTYDSTTGYWIASVELSTEPASVKFYNGTTTTTYGPAETFQDYSSTGHVYGANAGEGGTEEPGTGDEETDYGDFYLTGGFNSWGLTNKMTYAGDGLYYITGIDADCTEANGWGNFLIVDDTWTTMYGSSTWSKVSLPGSLTLEAGCTGSTVAYFDGDVKEKYMITFNAKTLEVTVSFVWLTDSHCGDRGWATTDSQLMTPVTPGIYTATGYYGAKGEATNPRFVFDASWTTSYGGGLRQGQTLEVTSGYNCWLESDIWEHHTITLNSNDNTVTVSGPEVLYLSLAANNWLVASTDEAATTSVRPKSTSLTDDYDAYRLDYDNTTGLYTLTSENGISLAANETFAIADKNYDSKYVYTTTGVDEGSYYTLTNVAQDGDEETNSLNSWANAAITVKKLTYEPTGQVMLINDATQTGIESIGSNDAPVEYYNLQGIRVSHPSAGVYLMRQGTTVTKVLINDK